jgi:energy-coupling factor transporter ATP-binding protein EcfA2
MTTAIEQIIKWANTLPGWQADAVRRLLEQGALTIADRAELYQILKASAGIEKASVGPIFPKVGGFSGTGKGQRAITLERVLDIQHVNAVKNGSTIPFAFPGITVVYGQNGSGKSSYARILKRACRARDTKEPIHPNVFDPSEKGPATATIKISDGTSSGIKLPWVDGQNADERLAQVAFFDSKCARVIVDASNEAVYVPYGCQVFDSLVELLKDFRARLQTERPTPIEPSASGVIAGSQSHLFLQQLSRNTKPEEIAAASAWAAADEDSLSSVTARIAQSKTKETLEKARRLKSTAARAGELDNAIEQGIKALSPERAVKVNGELDDLMAAEAAVQIAAQMSLQGEPLNSGASNEWRLLYEAARSYSTGIAYPGKTFPSTQASDLCVLCQQPLGEEARARFQRFKQFMEDKSEQTLQIARSQFSSTATAVRDLQLPNVTDYANVLDELSSDSRAQVETALASLSEEHKRWVVAIQDRKILEDVPAFGDIHTTLQALKTHLATAASQAELDADPVNVQKLELLRNELFSRKALSQVQAAITAYVEQKRLEFTYDQCINTLATRSISAKSKEIISAALTPQLQGDLKRELEMLGAKHLPLNVNITGREGGAHHQLAFVSTARQTKLSEILSEGEHCVVAVAGFLAELGGTPVLSPIVLDDPVSSLDHRYSRLIAKRLVEEAKKRQVIVFTHNIAFLVEIEKHCAGVPLCIQHVQRTGTVPGYCMEGLPWEAMSVKDRLKHIDEYVNEAAKLCGSDDNKYNEQAAHLYGLLRQTWEASIEHELLNRTVRRHDTDVQTQRLMEVEIQDPDCARIQEGMTKCSTWMAGHDKSAALDVNRPAPNELRKDIQELRDFAKMISGRRKTTEERRKAILKPQTSALG